MPTPITINVNFIDLTGSTVQGYMQAAVISPTGVYDLYVSGTGIIVPKISTSTTGTSASLSVWGNDVIVDAADGLNDTYYTVTLFNTSNVVIWTAAYLFTGTGPINLVGYPTLTVVPAPTGPIPTNILTGNNVFSGNNTFAGTNILSASTSISPALALGGNGVQGSLVLYTGSGTSKTTLQTVSLLSASPTISLPSVPSTLTGVAAKIDLTAQQANIGSTLLYNVPSIGGGGAYKVSSYAVVTRAASTSSVLPNSLVSFTDLDTGTAGVSVTLTNSSSGNTVGTTNGSVSSASTSIIYVPAGSTINYSTANYASVGGTSMQYALHIRVEYLG